MKHGLERFEYRINSWNPDMHRFMKDYIGSYKKPVILLGDLNVSHQVIDMHKKQPEIAGNTKEEIQAFADLMKDNGLIDTFRYFNPEK